MILLLAVSLLLIFITLTLGIFTREILSRGFRTALPTDLLELFLLGLLLSSIYFHLLSFFLPTDYRSLLPLAILSIFVIWRFKDQSRAAGRSIRQNLRLFFSRRNWPITTLVGIVSLAYWILPNANEDSIVYHIQSILWYEKFKVVPGLANLNGRLGFDPAPFLIESAWSFSKPAGQSLYPLNGVAALFLYAWLLLRMLRAGRMLPRLLYGSLLILTCRATLIYLPSPSPGILQHICIAYVLIRLAENSLTGRKDLSGNLVPAIIILYAIIVKPTAFALLPALLYLFFTLPQAQRSPALIARTTLLGLLIFLPWLGRNYILSGYFVFPFPSTGWLHPDWQVPPDAVKVEMNYIDRWPKALESFTPAAIARSRTVVGWFPYWVRNALRERLVDVLTVLIALVSPLYWLIRLIIRRSPAPLLIPWAIAFLATVAWLLASPVFRFGAMYIYVSLLLPALDAVDAFALKPQKRPSANGLTRQLLRIPAAIGLTLLAVFYIYSGFNRPTTYRFTLADCWWRPLRSMWHNDRERVDFPYRTLKNGTKLYIADDTHFCINAGLPCMQFNYGIVEMRGTRLEDGFRITVDEVKLHYPDLLKY